MGKVAVGLSSEGGHYDVDVCGGSGEEEREGKRKGKVGGKRWEAKGGRKRWEGKGGGGEIGR